MVCSNSAPGKLGQISKAEHRQSRLSMGEIKSSLKSELNKKYSQNKNAS